MSEKSIFYKKKNNNSLQRKIIGFLNLIINFHISLNLSNLISVQRCLNKVNYQFFGL